MIVGFSLLPEELVYSAGARFQSLMDYPNRESAVLELFGTRHALASVDLPVHLGHLAASLTPGHPYTVERLIDEHTLYPYYAAFLPPRRATSVRQLMESDVPKTPHMHTGMLRSGIRAPGWLRYCPLCVESDRALYGESFWHRVHQVPGVLVCPDHSVFLEQSGARARSPARMHEFVSAEDGVQMMAPRLVDAANPCHARLKGIASDAAWLLRHGTSMPDPVAVYRRYVELLVDRRYRSPGASSIGKFQTVVDDLRAFYTPALLDQLQCPLDPEQSITWLHRLLTKPRTA